MANLRTAIAAVLAMVSYGALAVERVATPVPFMVEAQSLPMALNEWAQQAGLQVVWQPDVSSRQMVAPRVAGTLDAEAALKLLLQGSGLTYSFIDVSTVAIRHESSALTTGIAWTTDASSSTPQRSSILQASASSAQPTNESAVAAEANKDRQSNEDVEEVVVTGSNIAGASPSSRVITLTREQMERSGMTSVAQAIQALPQNFAGGQNPTIFGAGDSANNKNVTGASKANLRGLGPNATLTLVDGHRFAANGTSPGVDLSVIPLSAVEKIEVLTDGASAIYGSDAIAGVINLVLRKDFDGAEAGARLGSSADGGGSDQKYSAAIGYRWGGGSVVLSSEYRDTEALSSVDRPFTSDVPKPTDLLPNQRQASGFVYARQDLGSSASIFLQGLYSNRKMTRSSSLPGSLAFSEVNGRQYGATGGVDVGIGGSWTAKLSATVARDFAPQHSTTTNTVSGMKTIGKNEYENKTTQGELVASGSLFSIATGDVLAAVGGGYREDNFNLLFPTRPTSNIYSSRRNVYAFSELRVPLVHESRRRGINRLELTLAGRYEDYSDFGNDTNPKIGLVYSPSPSMTMRASWGTSFRAPSFIETKDIRQVVVFALPAATPSGQTILLMSGGSNPGLKPETADSRSLALELRPESAPGLLLVGTAYSIKYEDRIVTPFNNPAVALANPAVYAPFITENPSAAEQQEFIDSASPGRFRNISGLPYSSAAVAYILEGSYENVSSREARGVDVELSYAMNLSGFSVGPFLSAAYVEEKERFTPASPNVEIAGTVFNTPSKRLRGGLTMRAGEWSYVGALNYTDEFDNHISAVQGNIGSWTTIDMTVTWAAERGALAGFQAQLAAFNLFNRDPPYVAPDSTTYSGIKYDSTNATPLGRFLSFEVMKRF